MTGSFILAIEPNPAQASELSAIAGRLGAEFVRKESAPEAVALLETRLPDLILTPALFSWRDGLALTGRLRELGEAADHIQSLTIPILDTSGPASSGGLLSALRRDRAQPAGPSACDADTFAEQVGIYLRRAVERRMARGPTGRTPTAPPDPPALPDQRDPPPSPAPYAEAAPAVRVAGATDTMRGSDRVEVNEAVEAPDWSRFDPTQARFVALLARLDEIAARHP